MRVAVLGLGSAGTRHARHLADLGAEPVAWDPDEARTAPEEVARAGSLDAALDGADAVVVASPNSNHAEQALAALERGIPVLVEKPLATNGTDADRVAAVAAKRGVTCGVAMNLRFLPGLVALERLVRSGELGTVIRARVWFGYDLRKWRPDDDYRQSYSARADLGGGIVFDAIHELDYLCWLLGPAASVAGITGRVSTMEIDVEDSASAAIEMASGAIASLDLDFVSPVYRRGCVVTGTEAVAEWDFSAQAVDVSGYNSHSRIEAAGDPATTYAAEIDDFLGAVRAGTKPSVGAAEGAAAVRLAEAIKLSASERRRVELQ